MKINYLLILVLAKFSYNLIFAQDLPPPPQVTPPIDVDVDFNLPPLDFTPHDSGMMAPQKDSVPDFPSPSNQNQGRSLLNLPFPSRQTPPNLCTTTNFFGCLNNLFFIVLRLIMFLAIILSTISIVWAGVLYIVKGGQSKEEIAKIHFRIVWAVWGLIVALISFSIIRILEFYISSGKITSIFNFAFASIPQQPQIPTQLKCGESGQVLPSIFSGTQVTKGIWATCLWYYVGIIMKLFYRLAIFLAVIFLSWAGILYVIQPEKVKEIHSRFIWGIIGALVAILSFTIVKLIEAFFLTITR